jgi:hypothetical protein
VAGLLALALILAGGAPLATASENEITSPAAQSTTLRASARAAAAAKPLPAGTLAQATPAAAPSADKGFFGTTAGRVALVVMAAGTGYMVYSAFKDNDPVKSVFR